MQNKVGFISVIIFLLVILTAISLFLFNCIKLYFEFDIDYSDLMYDELTFNGYERVELGKFGHIYLIYYEEYEKPFEVSNITINRKCFSANALKELRDNDTVKVYYRESSSEKFGYEYEICEMKSGDTTLLELSDYVSGNQNNQVLGIAVSAFMILGTLICMCLFVRTILKENKAKR